MSAVKSSATAYFAKCLFLRHAVALLIMAGLTTCSASKPRKENDIAPPTRVIWIAIDSLRADHLGAWGYERNTSPWMDKLANESATFLWTVSPANGTLKSVAGYFSGTPFSQLGNPYENFVPDDVITLAESLKDAGVRCSAYSANIYIPPHRGYAQGFTDYRLITTPSKASSSIEEIIADVTNHYRPTGRPEFIYIHTMDVHSPYRPPHPYGTEFTKPYSRNVVIEGNIYLDDRSHLANSLYPLWSQKHDVTQEDIDFLVGLYDGAIRYTDARLPALLEALAWDPKRDVLILTADHGEALYEHNWWGHFATLAPTEIHVPLIMNYGEFTDALHDEPVSLLDMYPTILDLFGIPHPENLAGTSLVPALTGGSVPPHPVYAESALGNGANAAVISGDWWYVLSGNRSQYKPWHAWPYEEFLYRYGEDPQGRINLISVELEIAKELNAQLRTFNPRWSAYTPDLIRRRDEDVSLGENLFSIVPDESVVNAPITRDDASWQFDVSVSGVTYTAHGLTPLEPLWLEIPYSLDAGSLNISLWPAAFRWPGTAREIDVWDHVCTKPGENQNVKVVILPKGESITLRVTAAPATRARVLEPTLRSMDVHRIEPWPRPASESEGGVESEPELVQRMRALGYL